jgi:predicted DNA-binding transcriptional regulator YafY
MYGVTISLMQASRWLSLLMLLQTRGRMSAQQLSAELEVSVRTIHRDIDSLSASGVPVWAERGRQGGFVLQEGWRTKLTGLTATEAQAVFLGGLPGPARELGLGEAMASAQLKLLAALPAGWQEDARRVSARFHLDPIDWYRGSSPVNHLPSVAQAVWHEERLRLQYESWERTSEREVEPLGLVLKAGIWYVAARTAVPNGKVRTYRLSSILSLTATGEHFTRPKDFDLASYWTASTQRFEAELYQDEAVLRVTRQGLKTLNNFSPAVAEAAGRTQAPDPQAGWLQVTIPIESVSHAAAQLLRLGAQAEVLKPAALRRELRNTLRDWTALYAD